MNEIKQSLPIEFQSTFELKLHAGRYLTQRPSCFETSIAQEWKGDYLLIVIFSEFIFVF